MILSENNQCHHVDTSELAGNTELSGMNDGFPRLRGIYRRVSVNPADLETFETRDLRSNR
jgi:hypothetical protein